MSELRRDLTLTHGIAIVVGITIGTGVFLKSAPMAQAVGSPLLVMVAWAVAGLHKCQRFAKPQAAIRTARHLKGERTRGGPHGSLLRTARRIG